MNFITPAYAQAAGPGLAELFSPQNPIWMMLIILVIMYFLILRPQQKRAKAHQDMITNVRRGDTIVTSGGIVGKVTKVTDEPEIEVEIAPNVRVRILRAMISDVRTKGQPVTE